MDEIKCCANCRFAKLIFSHYYCEIHKKCGYKAEDSCEDWGKIYG